MAKKIAYSYVPDRGWTGKGFSIPHAAVPREEVRLTLAPRGREPYDVPIAKAEKRGELLKITPVEFDYRSNWTLHIGKDAYTRKEMDEELCEGLEHFAPGKKGDVLYRLYSPKASTPRPMILFLHGGGNGGTDNITQIAADLSCNHFVKKYPDFYVLAPQAQEPDFSMMVGRIGKIDFAHSDQDGDFGWSRRYLGEVCDLIRGMIKDGKDVSVLMRDLQIYVLHNMNLAHVLLKMIILLYLQIHLMYPPSHYLFLISIAMIA